MLSGRLPQYYLLTLLSMYVLITVLISKNFSPHCFFKKNIILFSFQGRSRYVLSLRVLNVLFSFEVFFYIFFFFTFCFVFCLSNKMHSSNAWWNRKRLFESCLNMCGCSLWASVYGDLLGQLSLESFLISVSLGIYC